MKRLLCGAVGVTLAIATVGSTGAARADDGPGTVAAGDAAVTKAVETSSIDSYIVVLRDRPLIDTIGGEQVGTPVADASEAAITASHDAVLADEGLPAAAKVQDYANGINGFAASISHEQAEQLATNPKVAAVLPDELLQLDGGSGGSGGDGGGDGDHGHGGWPGGGSGGPSTGVAGNDDLADFLGLTARGEAWKSGVTGEGVTIGVIDSGIWPEHPSFADDGSYAKPTFALPTTDGPTCQFGTSTVEPAKSLDAAFRCNNKLIGAREELVGYKAQFALQPDEFDSARDNAGHGTHVASTAGGNGGVQARLFGVDYGRISGIAPRARLVAYKAAGRKGALTSDVAAAVDQAIADHVDVINLSIGGPSIDLLQPNLTSLLAAASAKIFVAASAGNGGPAAGSIGGAAAVPWTTAVGATTQRRVFRGTITLDLGRFGWGPRRAALSVVGASVTPGTNGKVGIVDGAGAGSEQCLDGKLDPAKVAGKVVLCLLDGNSPVGKSAAVQHAGGVGLVVYNPTDDQELFTDNAFIPMVMIDNSPGRLLKTYIRLATNPKVTLSTGGTWTSPSAPSMVSFSSRGPNRAAPDVVKPDLTAPGMQVLAGNSPVSDVSVSAPGQLFQAISGASMAAPVVAGTLALLKQAHRDWTPAMAKSALMTTADTGVVDNDRRTPAGPFAMGAGLVDPGVVAAAGSAFNPGLVYDAGVRDYLGFLCDAAPAWFGVYGSPSTCATLPKLGVPTTAPDLNAPTIGVSALPGTATVKRTVTSVATTTLTWKASVKAPAGYRVTVSPSALTLKPGATAAFTVSFVNTGTGRVGEWSTGSLTWTSGRFAARSVIAVQGSTFAAPADVAGTGTTCSLPFIQRFGYTGPYSATAHGLAPRVGRDGVIRQDPDRTIPSPDDDEGGVLAFPVAIHGVTHARWTLKFPEDDPDDIDLSLFKDGTMVAQSGNAGTNEQIDLVDPPDGDYTLYAHGFRITEAGGRAISVGQWLVPLAPVASTPLSVTAPTSARLATTATVTVDWHDLQPGTSYLGSITHADGAGVLQTTLVEVDTASSADCPPAGTAART